MDGFEQLSNTELNELLNAPALIVLLIAGADGVIDKEESYWSTKLVHTQTYTSPVELKEYFQEVNDNFAAKVSFFTEFYPQNPAERNEKIAEVLSHLNGSLAKMDIKLAAGLYKGWIGLAEETAKASGGFLRIGAIAADEYRWVKLPMITPIVYKSESNQKEEEDED